MEQTQNKWPMEKKLHNKELHNSYCPQDITEITSTKRLTGHVACVGTKADSVSGYPEGLVISSLPPGKYHGSIYRKTTK
jgi:hypothetical protein